MRVPAAARELEELGRWTGVIHVKRVHAPPSEADGRRILVDRIWPRGVSRDRARLDAWIRDVAPTPGLRRWFGHAPERWPEFVRRYHAELADDPHVARVLVGELKGERVTLLFGARDERRNNAVALKAYVEALRAAMQAYEEGGVRGLCAEGRRELAVEAMRRLGLGGEALLRLDREPRGEP